MIRVNQTERPSAEKSMRRAVASEKGASFVDRRRESWRRGQHAEGVVAFVLGRADGTRGRTSVGSSSSTLFTSSRISNTYLPEGGRRGMLGSEWECLRNEGVVFQSA